MKHTRTPKQDQPVQPGAWEQIKQGFREETVKAQARKQPTMHATNATKRPRRCWMRRRQHRLAAGVG